MSCNCIERIEKKLNEKMIEEYPRGEVIDEVNFINKTLVFDHGHSVLILGNPVIGRVRVGKAVRRFDTEVYPTYCPFCGKKIKEGGEDERK